jgi:DNA/RNA-binding domain of Phe-tRNA-synthetase-like protein
MSHQLTISPEIFEKNPDYAAVIIYANGLENGDSNDFSIKLLQSAETEKRKVFEDMKPSEHEYIIPWRNTFKDFGSKPSKYLCSTEALLTRTVKGQDIPHINCIVDIYNAVSIRYVLPIGGEDRDCLTSDLILKIATGDEPFVTQQNGEPIVDYPNPGEPIWVDSSGVTCRRWNWRQCQRTQLTVNTRNAYFVLDRLPPYPIELLTEASSKLIEYLQVISPNCQIEHKIITAGC